MRPCPHAEWLRLWRVQHGWNLTSETRLQQLRSSEQEPVESYPSIAMFVGGKSKNEALERTFPCNNKSRRNGNCLASLREDCKPVSAPYPLLFADVDLPLRYAEKEAPTALSCHEATQYKVAWADGRSGEDIANTVFARLLLPFVDAVFLFVDDLCAPVAKNISDRIRKWTAVRPVTKMTKPRLVLVVADEDLVKELLEELYEFSSIAEAFASIEISIQKSNLFDFRKRVEITIEAQRMSRRVHGTLFSHSHLSALFERAIEHVANGKDEDMDIIKLSRQHNMVDSRLVGHLSTFHHLCREFDIPASEMIQHIASALVMDHLSPKMHCKLTVKEIDYQLTSVDFDPDAVFCTLYRDHLIQSAAGRLEGSKIDEFITTAQKAFAAMCGEVGAGRRTALDLRLSAVRGEFPLPPDFSSGGCAGRSEKNGLKALYSNGTCLLCLRRKPEHVLPCNHALCDKCVQAVYPPSFGVESCYDIQCCIICSKKGTLKVKLVPSTASFRTAVFDGGGIRGVVSLELFRALDATRNLPYSIQDDFDLAIGTSTGNTEPLESSNGTDISQEVLLCYFYSWGDAAQRTVYRHLNGLQNTFSLQARETEFHSTAKFLMY